MRNAGQLATLIKQLCKTDIAELGNNDSTQNTYIFDFMSRALHELASYAGVIKVSDALSITADGFISFLKDGSAITDMYEPIRILDTNGDPVDCRNDFTDGYGWFRDSFSSQIHMKGLNTSYTYTLYYKAYPQEITASTQTPEFPPSGFLALCYYTSALIKESKAFYDEANHYYSLANQRMRVIDKANTDGKGRRKTVKIVNHWG